MISRGKNALDIIGHAEEHLIERIAENMHTFGMLSHTWPCARYYLYEPQADDVK